MNDALTLIQDAYGCFGRGDTAFTGFFDTQAAAEARR